MNYIERKLLKERYQEYRSETRKEKEKEEKQIPSALEARYWHSDVDVCDFGPEERILGPGSVPIVVIV